MVQFKAGVTKTATVTMKNTGTSRTDYTTYLYLGVTQAVIIEESFSLNGGESKAVSFQVTMPTVLGMYYVFLDVYSGGILLTHYMTEDQIEITFDWSTDLPTQEEIDFAVEYGREKLREYGWQPGGQLSGEQWQEVYRYINPVAQRFTDDWAQEFEDWKVSDSEYLDLFTQREELLVGQPTWCTINALGPGTCLDYSGDYVINCYTKEVIGHVAPLMGGTIEEYNRWGCRYLGPLYGDYRCDGLSNAYNGVMQLISGLITAFYASIQWKIDARDQMYVDVLVI